MTADVQQGYLDAARAVGELLPGRSLSWMQALRGRAAEQFAAQGFPTTRDEMWKYTNVAPLTRQQFELPTAGASVDRALAEGALFSGLDGPRLVFVNGRYASALSSVTDLPAGAIVGSLAQTLSESPGRVEPYLGRALAFEQHPFAALNASFLTDGAFLSLPRGSVIEAPISLVFLATGDQLLAQPYNLLIAEEGSQATVVEHYVGLSDGRCFTNSISEAVLGPGAVLEHYRVQQAGPQSFHVGGTHVRQERDSRYTSHAIDLGGLLVRNDIRAVLAAEGAECTLNGLYLVDGRQHVDNHTLVDHAKPRGTSREYYKGVLDGRSRAVFNGRVVVHPDAQHTDANQMNNNLLLSKDAEVDTKPELEIYADDVKCSHGATVGQLDADALFYLRSRAVSESVARDLLTYAFANDILARFRLAPIRQALEKKLTTRLLHGRDIKELELV